MPLPATDPEARRRLHRTEEFELRPLRALVLDPWASSGGCTATAGTPKPSLGSAGASAKPRSGSSPVPSAPARPSRGGPRWPGSTPPGIPSATYPGFDSVRVPDDDQPDRPLGAGPV